jgi:2-dehydropantoate 2-reductase
MGYIVYGAGAVGAVIGARMHEQGAEVVLVARGEHLRAIQRSGLVVESPGAAVTVRVRAVGHPSEIAFGPDDVVLLATKTQDGAQALDDLREVAGSKVPVVCLQNGVESARIAIRRFDAVAAAMTMLPGVHLRPGVV